MKLKTLIGILVVLFASLLGGAYWFFVVNVVQGSGVEATEIRELEAFHKIELACSGDVDVTIGSPQEVIITGDDNIVPLLTTEISGGCLTIDSEKRYRSKLGIKVKVVVAKLDELEISGSGDVKAGAIEGDSFEGSISGSGSLKLVSFSGLSCQTRIGGSGSIENGKLEGEELKAKVSGSGSLKVSGQVTILEAGVGGSGNVNLSELTSQTAVAKVSGSGSIHVRAEESLEAGISGSGDITQYGAAKPDAKVSGSGSVRQK